MNPSSLIRIIFSIVAVSTGISFFAFKNLKRLGVVLLFLGVGGILCHNTESRLALRSPAAGLSVDRITAFTGFLTEESRIIGDGRTLYPVELMEVEGENGVSASARGRAVIITGDSRQWPAGRIVKIERGIHSGGEWFSYPRRDDVSAIGYKSRYYHIREEIRGEIGALFSRLGPSADLLNALLLGDKNYLTLMEKDLFRRAGVSHVLALSGMHLGIIVALVGLLFARFLGKRAAFFISLSVALGYLFLAGFSPSLVRAFVMFTLSGFFILGNRPADPIEILGYSFVLLGVLMPLEADSLSFILSFLALFGIFTLGKKMNCVLSGTVPRVLRLPLAASIGAQWATSFVLFTSFGVVYPVGIIASLLLTPMVTLFIWGGLISLPFLGMGVFSLVIRRLLEVLSILIGKTAEIASRFPGITVDPEYVLPVTLILLFCGILLYHKEVRIRLWKWKPSIPPEKV